MADFLLELRCEEIPARMQKGARAELEKLFRSELTEAGVEPGEVTVWSTPRRLALIAKELPTATEAVREEAKGPPVGAPDQAVDGFCRKNGVTRDQLEERDVKGRATYFAVIEKPGQAVSELLAAAIPAIVRDFSWPKSMRWGAASISSESVRWVRPLSGIVALLDGEVVPCEVDGITSGRETLGHRFHSEGAIAIASADEYAEKLSDAHVIVDHEVRAGIIREGARKAARAVGLSVVEDEGLVVENAGLTEWPVPLLGRFDESYLDVPPEVIQLTARVNQKYFVCEQREPDGTAKLANAFICTANIAADDPAVVVDGNRKVLAARLSDARFFWELDQKTSLEEHARKLERITFHEKLGTVADKVERVAKLARWLCEEGIVNGDPDLAEQAARLCKADLVTEMVGEFPELQGLMGGYYAEKEGLPREVSNAIRDHYKPVGQGDEVPTAPVTVSVSLADKLDTLGSFFFENQIPTGSKDPFALRRAMLAVIRTVLKNELRVSLNRLLSQPIYEISDKSLTASVLGTSYRTEDEVRFWRSLHRLDTIENRDEFLAKINASYDYDHTSVIRNDYSGLTKIYRTQTANAIAKLEKFCADRAEVMLRDSGIGYDIFNAAYLGQGGLLTWVRRTEALEAFVKTDNGANLLAGYKRAANILKKEEWDSADGNDLSYSPEPAEKALIDALGSAAPKAAAAIETEDFEAAMEALASLRVPIDAFFDEVTVNDDDPAKREARLALLARFRDAVHRVADFSRIEG